MPTQQVYQTDSEGYYAGTTYADENPVRPGTFIMPGGSYADAPDLTALQPYQIYQRSADGNSWTIVPNYQGVTYWNADGTSETIETRGTPLPTGASLTEVTPPLTTAQKKALFESYVQAYIDAPAKAWGYDSAVSCISYIGDPFAQFNADGLAMRAFRSSCWTTANGIYSQVTAGTIPAPTKDALLAMLPTVPTQPVVS